MGTGTRRTCCTRTRRSSVQAMLGTACPATCYGTLQRCAPPCDVPALPSACVVEQQHKPCGTPTKLKASVFGRQRIQRLNELKFDEALIASFAPSEQQVIMKVLSGKGTTYERSSSPVRNSPQGAPRAGTPTLQHVNRRHTYDSQRSSSPAPGFQRSSIPLQGEASTPSVSTPTGQLQQVREAAAARSLSVGRAPSRCGRYGPSATHHVLMTDNAQVRGSLCSWSFA